MYKNKLNHIILIAKHSYYDNEFENAKKDLTLTWKLLNEVINKQTSKLSLSSSFKCEGESIPNTKVTADRFCKYFTNIGPSLPSAITALNSNFHSFLINNNNNPITLKPTTTIEHEDISKTLSSGKALVMTTFQCV